MTQQRSFVLASFSAFQRSGIRYDALAGLTVWAVVRRSPGPGDNLPRVTTPD